MSKELIVEQGFTLNQNGEELLVTKLSGDDLRDNYEVEKMTADNPDGYQRDLKTPRIKALDAFIQKGNIVPPALVLSVRYKPRKLRNGQWAITLPLIVIDGQHRVGGLDLSMIADPKFGKFEFAVVIVHCKQQETEAKLFVDINLSQKAVSKDYAVANAYNLQKSEAGRKILGDDEILGHNADWQTQAYRIAIRLNNDGGVLPCPNPLQRRIKLLREPEPTYKNPVTQSTMVRSMEPAINIDDIDQHRLGTFMLAFWRGVALTYRRPVTQYSEHMILRNVGVEVFNRVFPLVYHKLTLLNGDPTNPTHYSQVLALGKLQGLKDADWRIDGRVGKTGSSFTMISQFAQEIKDSIEKNIYSLELKGLN
jgi:DGQHR domain-containing protein